MSEQQPTRHVVALAAVNKALGFQNFKEFRQHCSN